VADLQALTEALPLLQSCKLGECKLASLLALRLLPHLHTLELRWLSMPLSELSVLADMSVLRSLTVHFLMRNEDDMLFPAATSQVISQLAHCAQLTHVELGGAIFTADEVKALVKAVPCMLSCGFCYCTLPPLSDLAEAIQLRKLHITRCNKSLPLIHVEALAGLRSLRLLHLVNSQLWYFQDNPTQAQERVAVRQLLHSPAFAHILELREY